MKKLIIINGPNLNLLGKREPNIYGSLSFTEFLEEVKEKYPQVHIDYFQSNIEGEIVDRIQAAALSSDYIFLNAGAYTHTSLAIADAVKAIDTPTLELHISNVMDREEIRHVSLISKNCIGVISGFGLSVYRMASHYVLSTREVINNY